MFWALLCLSSGEQDHVLLRIVFCTGCVELGRKLCALCEGYCSIVAGKSYETVNQFIYLGSKINSKNLIKEEIRLRMQAGNISLFANKKLLKNKDLNAASKLLIYMSIVRPVFTYGCETRAMAVAEQNRLLIFKRRVLRKIFGPTQDNDGTWRIKRNEELETLIKKKTIVRFIKSQRFRWAAHVCNQNGHNKNC